MRRNRRTAPPRLKWARKPRQLLLEQHMPGSVGRRQIAAGGTRPVAEQSRRLTRGWRDASHLNAVPSRESAHVHVLHAELDHFDELRRATLISAETMSQKLGHELCRVVGIYPGCRAGISASPSTSGAIEAWVDGADHDTMVAITTEFQRRVANLNFCAHAPASVYSSVGIGVIRVPVTGFIEQARIRARETCRLALASGSGKTRFASLTPPEQTRTSANLRSALELGKITLYAQEIAELNVDPERRHGLRFEVLMRMRDEHGRSWNPSDAFEIAERAGLAPLLDRHVLHAVLGALAETHEHLDRIDLCAINLSAASLSNRDMPETIFKAIRASGIPPSKLCFEITETAEIKDHSESWETLNALRELGCWIAIDDFGSGYANFRALNRHAFDLVKIDGAFTRGLLVDPALRADFTGLLQSARVRGLPVVAEFIENQPTLELLKQLGVRFGQGFHLHRPEPLRTFLSGRLGDTSSAQQRYDRRGD